MTSSPRLPVVKPRRSPPRAVIGPDGNVTLRSNIKTWYPLSTFLAWSLAAFVGGTVLGASVAAILIYLR